MGGGNSKEEEEGGEGCVRCGYTSSGCILGVFIVVFL